MLDWLREELREQETRRWQIYWLTQDVVPETPFGDAPPQICVYRWTINGGDVHFQEPGWLGMEPGAFYASMSIFLMNYHILDGLLSAEEAARMTVQPRNPED